MSKYLLTAQKIIWDTLNGNISANVYDDVPDQAPGNPTQNMPYVVIGQDQSFPFDTDSWTGEAVTVELHIWSAYRGKREVKQLMSEIYDLLHQQPLTAAGVAVLDCLHTFSSITGMAADNYIHGMVRYRLTLTEVL